MPQELPPPPPVGSAIDRWLNLLWKKVNGAAQITLAQISGLGTGVKTFLETPSSANLRSALTDETGSGSVVFSASPTLSNVVITGSLISSGNNTIGDSTSDVLTITSADLNVVHADSSVNRFEITGGAAGFYPTLSVTGSDSDIGMIFTTKNFQPIEFASDVRLTGGLVPSSASATGFSGIIRWDTDYIYVCTATNTWKRVAIATW